MSYDLQNHQSCTKCGQPFIATMDNPIVCYACRKKESINHKIRSDKVYWSCFDCAEKYRTNKPYDGAATVHEGTCDICEQTKTVTSAKKLFGYHKFI